MKSQARRTTIINKADIEIIESGEYSMLPTTVSLVSWIPGIYSEIDGTIVIRINVIIIAILYILLLYWTSFQFCIYILYILILCYKTLKCAILFISNQN